MTERMKENRRQPPPVFRAVIGRSCRVAPAKVGGAVSLFSVAPMADHCKD